MERIIWHVYPVKLLLKFARDAAKFLPSESLSSMKSLIPLPKVRSVPLCFSAGQASVFLKSSAHYLFVLDSAAPAFSIQPFPLG
jgi:hypothetical protein